VSSMTYIKPDLVTHLESLTPRVMEAYINSMLEGITDECDDEDGAACFASSTTG